MIQQILVQKQSQEKSQSCLARSDAKNALLASESKFIGMDMMGLSWIFTKDDDLEIC